jgi:hypothetical protein
LSAGGYSAGVCRAVVWSSRVPGLAAVVIVLTAGIAGTGVLLAWMPRLALAIVSAPWHALQGARAAWDIQRARTDGRGLEVVRGVARLCRRERLRLAGRLAAWRMAAAISRERGRLEPEEIVRRVGVWIGSVRRRWADW